MINTRIHSIKQLKGINRFSLIAVLIAMLLVGLIASPVYAAAPQSGVVVEGVSVPGAALGDSRAHVEASFDQPTSCQDLAYYDGRRGEDGICTFPVEDGGQVIVHYLGVNGGPADGSAEDVVFIFRWYQQVSGWTTTAGVNTTLALNNPQAVIDAYPDATVIYNPTFGNIESIEDKSLGILVDYSFDYLSGRLSVSMVIYSPRTDDPVRIKETHIDSIELQTQRRSIIGTVKVLDDRNLNAAGARVSAFWTLPDNSTQQVSAVTDGFGQATFELNKAKRKGTYTLTIENVVLDGYTFDRENSVLTASIKR
jgi:hypothetical protein